MKKKKRDKYGISMYSFSILPDPKKDLKLLERLESIQDAQNEKKLLSDKRS